MSAELLRQAAAVLRERADAATPGPWSAQLDGIKATAPDALIPDKILVAYYTGHDHRLGFKKTGAAPDVEYIATVDPDFGLAVADWLDITARRFEEGLGYPGDYEKPLAVARVILGSAS